MIYSAILAGGIGKRIKNITIPKQFAEIDGVPIIIYSISQFLKSSLISKIIVSMNKEWIEYTYRLFNNFFSDEERKRIVVISGGKDRLESFSNVAYYIKENYGIDDEDILICHESVRPFVTLRMIEECIRLTLRYKIAATFIPVNDTIYTQNRSGMVVASENRDKQVQGQTPSGFNIKLLLEIIESMSDDEWKNSTSTTQLFINKGIDIPIVEGDAQNFKITTDFDLVVADFIAKRGNRNE